MKDFNLWIKYWRNYNIWRKKKKIYQIIKLGPLNVLSFIMLHDYHCIGVMTSYNYCNYLIYEIFILVQNIAK